MVGVGLAMVKVALYCRFDGKGVVVFGGDGLEFWESGRGRL